MLEGPLKNHIPANEMYLMVSHNPFIMIEEVEREHTAKEPRLH
jgi:hypothetical protein